MNPEFLVITTSRFERELKKLASQHAGLPKLFRSIIQVLKTDPTIETVNTLTAVPTGEAQYRIRAGRFRFRYDIEDRTGFLKACSLRREDTY